MKRLILLLLLAAVVFGLFVPATSQAAPVACKKTVDNKCEIKRKKRKPQMTIAFDAASHSGYQAAQTSYSWDHTVAPDVQYGGLVVGVSLFAAGSVVSVTYDGLPLAYVRHDEIGIHRTEIWSMREPTLGTHAVVVTLSASLASISGAASYTFFGGIGNHAGDTGTTEQVQVFVTRGQDSALVFSVMSSNSTLENIEDSDQQINRWKAEGALGSGFGSDAGPVLPAGETNMVYWSLNFLVNWAMSVAVLTSIVHNPPPIHRF